MRMRRRCPQCGEVREFASEKQGVCSTACEVARRKAIGWYARNAMTAKPRRYQAPMALEGYGLLTEREQGIYMRSRVNTLTYAREKAARKEAVYVKSLRVAS